MSIQRALLIIADIGGYTRFMTLRRMSLAHAQGIVAHLLEAVIDASQGLKLIEVEGDAAFFYAPHSEDQEALTAGRAAEKAVAMHRAFHTRQREIVTLNRCGCDGCAAMNNLKIKFVAHVGEVATQKVKRLSKLAGVDVIVVHRMLKNLVPVPEYLLMSEPVFRHAGERLRQRARGLRLELEGLGKDQAYFVNLEDIAEIAPAPQITWLGRLRVTAGVVLRGIPCVLGVKKPRRLPAGEGVAAETFRAGLDRLK